MGQLGQRLDAFGLELLSLVREADQFGVFGIGQCLSPSLFHERAVPIGHVGGELAVDTAEQISLLCSHQRQFYLKEREDVYGRLAVSRNRMPGVSRLQPPERAVGSGPAVQGHRGQEAQARRVAHEGLRPLQG